jgi:ArsR family transcriptional regulator
MTAAARAKYSAQARVLKALAHPARLLMVEALSRGERCVCELTDLIGMAMPTVSRHLSLLRNAGIIEDEKRGPQVFYRLRAPCVLDFFTCVEALQRAGRQEWRSAPVPGRRNAGKAAVSGRTQSAPPAVNSCARGRARSAKQVCAGHEKEGLPHVA